MRSVLAILAVFFLSCCAPEYKGDITYISNVPRAVVEREYGLLRERINLWARQTAQSDLVNNTTREPHRNDEGISLRWRIDAGKRVLAMLEDKLRTPGPTVDFTRKEWGRAERVLCTLAKGIDR